MQTKKLVSSLALCMLVSGFATGTALAQDAQPDAMQKTSSMPMQKHDMKAMKQRHRMGRMTGRHMMPATVTSIDKTTGVVDVNSEGMNLRVHFPPASLSDVNKGDKITLMLGFRKGDAMTMHKKAGQMEKK